MLSKQKNKLCYLKERLSDEEGATLIMMPFIIVLAFSFFMLMFNVMWMSQNRYHIQLMCDSATRAGTQAVEYSYAVRERTGHGYGDYHVYSELNEDRADANVNKILDAYKNDINGFIMEEVHINESGTTSPVWNSRIFEYEDESITSEKQYQNGVVNLRIKAKIPMVEPEMFGADKMTEIEHSSQSVARGSVTEIR